MFTVTCVRKLHQSQISLFHQQSDRIITDTDNWKNAEYRGANWSIPRSYSSIRSKSFWRETFKKRSDVCLHPYKSFIRGGSVCLEASKPRSLEASKPLAWLIRKKEIRKEETERKKDQKESESSTDGDLLNTEQTGYRTERLVILFIRTFSSHVCRDRTSVSIQTTISSQPGPEHRTEPALEQMYINVYTEYSRDLQTTDKEVRS